MSPQCLSPFRSGQGLVSAWVFFCAQAVQQSRYEDTAFFVPQPPPRSLWSSLAPAVYIGCGGYGVGVLWGLAILLLRRRHRLRCGVDQVDKALQQVPAAAIIIDGGSLKGTPHPTGSPRSPGPSLASGSGSHVKQAMQRSRRPQAGPGPGHEGRRRSPSPASPHADSKAAAAVHAAFPATRLAVDTPTALGPRAGRPESPRSQAAGGGVPGLQSPALFDHFNTFKKSPVAGRPGALPSRRDGGGGLGGPPSPRRYLPPGVAGSAGGGVAGNSSPMLRQLRVAGRGRGAAGGGPRGLSPKVGLTGLPCS